VFESIQAYIRKSASRDRIVERIGPFLATISPGTDHPYLSYAIPDDGADPSAADVEALIATFQRHKRVPRLEYMPKLAPKVEAALIAHGFKVEFFPPLMVYDQGMAQGISTPERIELIAPSTDEELLGMVTAQHEAYGEEPPESSVIEGQRQFIEAGGIAVYARDAITKEPAGGGVCTVAFGNTTELAGVGVRPVYRRRGIAGAMTAWLVQKAVEQGTTTVFLSAAGEAEARIYARIGFKQIGEGIHISLSKQSD
jgi:N-acetylglutamate synthase-like GNAT family acetyltransferase